MFNSVPSYVLAHEVNLSMVEYSSNTDRPFYMVKVRDTAMGCVFFNSYNDTYNSCVNDGKGGDYRHTPERTNIADVIHDIAQAIGAM